MIIKKGDEIIKAWVKEDDIHFIKKLLNYKIKKAINKIK